MSYDRVIHNGTIVTVNPDSEIITDGVICIKAGEIVEIIERATKCPLPVAAKTVDARGGVIMPGLINTHTHLPMTLFRGMADDLPLREWLENHIFPAETDHINPETVHNGTLLACAEMLLSGTTTCCDGYFYEDAVAKALSSTGMRAVLAQGIVDFPAPGVPDPARNISHAVDYAEKWRGVSDKIEPSIFCHSPYTCSDRTIIQAKKVAAEYDLLFQIHVAETREEWEQVLAEHGRTPVQYLDQIGILDPRTLLVHCIWIDDDDIAILARRKAHVAHAPESNMKLSSGIAPVHKLINAGITLGLGTDGCASNNNLDMFLEMDSAAKLQKVKTGDPTVLDAATTLKTATIKAAKAIGLDRKIGSLEIGKAADLIIIDTDQPHLVPMYHPVSHIVYAVKGADVTDVMVAGKFLVRRRKLLTLDVEEIMYRANVFGKTFNTQRRQNNGPPSNH